jgi:hypothetical protein
MAVRPLPICGLCARAQAAERKAIWLYRRDVAPGESGARERAHTMFI